jgi:alanine racemase
MDQGFVEQDGIDAESGDEVTLCGYDARGSHLTVQEGAALIDCEGCDLTIRMIDRVERTFLS